jgi:hypothetical protein
VLKLVTTQRVRRIGEFYSYKKKGYESELNVVFTGLPYLKLTSANALSSKDDLHSEEGDSRSYIMLSEVNALILEFL